MKYVVIYEQAITPETWTEAIRTIDPDAEVVCVDWGLTPEQMKGVQLVMEKGGPDAGPGCEAAFAEVADADVILTHLAPIQRSLMDAAPNLKMIGTVRGGMEHLDIAAATERNIPAIHCIRNADCTSDFAVGLMLAETRNIARAHAAIKAGAWRKDYVNSGYTTAMCNMTVGIVGLGHIGKLVARKVAAFGSRIIGYDPYVSAEQLEAAGLDVELVGLEELFSTADIVTLHLRVTEETKDMVDARLIGLMKPTAYLINAARAGVLVKDALVDALRERRIGGAALDVYWQEPLPEDDPLLTLDNITLTPHYAGTVIDAIPKSPILLMREIQRFRETGTSDMVVNLRDIEL